MIVLEAYDDRAESPVGSGRLNILGRRAAMRRLTRGTQEIQETHNSGQLPTKQVSHATLSHEQNAGTELEQGSRGNKSPLHIIFFPYLRRLHGIPRRASKAPGDLTASRVIYKMKYRQGLNIAPTACPSACLVLNLGGGMSPVRYFVCIAYGGNCSWTALRDL